MAEKERLMSLIDECRESLAVLRNAPRLPPEHREAVLELIERELAEAEQHLEQERAKELSGKTETWLKPKALFELGYVTATPLAIEKAGKELILYYIRRHAFGDWGVILASDKERNDRAVKAGNPILSSYPIDATRACKAFGENSITVLTDAGRCSTVIWLPQESPIDARKLQVMIPKKDRSLRHRFALITGLLRR